MVKWSTRRVWTISLAIVALVPVTAVWWNGLTPDIDTAVGVLAAIAFVLGSVAAVQMLVAALRGEGHSHVAPLFLLVIGAGAIWLGLVEGQAYLFITGFPFLLLGAYAALDPSAWDRRLTATATRRR